MSTLGKLYSQDNTNIKVRKTHMVDLNLLYIEDGFNVRDIDLEHVASIKDAYDAGKDLPALVVKVMPDGRIKIIDGHHRYLAAKEAGVLRHECKDFTGSEADQVAAMITSSQGRQLTSTERAAAYLRLVNHGYENAEIAKLCGRSRADVDNHLTLAKADNEIVEHVKNGKITMHEAIGVVRNTTGNAVAIINEAVKKADGKKIKPTDLNRFTNKMAMQFVELVINGHYLDDLDSVEDEEVLTLVNAYLKSVGK